jgi:putative hydrolase of the HAD superfamily
MTTPPQPAPAGALLLDLGGVVLRSGAELSEELARREPAFAPPLRRLGGIGGERDELWQRMLRREVTERHYWAERAADFGRVVGEDWDTRTFIRRLYDVPRDQWLREEAADLMAQARAAGRRVGALSNDLADFHGADWVATEPFFRQFDVIVDASVTGVMKPDPQAYRLAAEALGCPPEQIVFLDDMPWNVEGAERAGLVAVRLTYDDPLAAFDTARRHLGLAPRDSAVAG